MHAEPLQPCIHYAYACMGSPACLPAGSSPGSSAGGRPLAPRAAQSAASARAHWLQPPAHPLLLPPPNPPTPRPSQIPYAWGAGLVDAATHDFVAAACGGAYWNATRGSPCWEALDVVDAAIGEAGARGGGLRLFWRLHVRM